MKRPESPEIKQPQQEEGSGLLRPLLPLPPLLPPPRLIPPFPFRIPLLQRLKEKKNKFRGPTQDNVNVPGAHPSGPIFPQQTIYGTNNNNGIPGSLNGPELSYNNPQLPLTDLQQQYNVVLPPNENPLGTQVLPNDNSGIGTNDGIKFNPSYNGVQQPLQGTGFELPFNKRVQPFVDTEPQNNVPAQYNKNSDILPNSPHDLVINTKDGPKLNNFFNKAQQQLVDLQQSDEPLQNTKKKVNLEVLPNENNGVIDYKPQIQSVNDRQEYDGPEPYNLETSQILPYENNGFKNSVNVPNLPYSETQQQTVNDQQLRKPLSFDRNHDIDHIQQLKNNHEILQSLPKVVQQINQVAPSAPYNQNPEILQTQSLDVIGPVGGSGFNSIYNEPSLEFQPPYIESEPFHANVDTSQILPKANAPQQLNTPQIEVRVPNVQRISSITNNNNQIPLQTSKIIQQNNQVGPYNLSPETLQGSPNVIGPVGEPQVDSINYVPSIDVRSSFNKPEIYGDDQIMQPNLIVVQQTNQVGPFDQNPETLQLQPNGNVIGPVGEPEINTFYNGPPQVAVENQPPYNEQSPYNAKIVTSQVISNGNNGVIASEPGLTNNSPQQQSVNAQIQLNTPLIQAGNPNVQQLNNNNGIQQSPSKLLQFSLAVPYDPKTGIFQIQPNGILDAISDGKIIQPDGQQVSVISPAN